MRGLLQTRYWARWTSDDSDHDLYATLTLDIGNAEEHKVTGRFMGRIVGDLDGSEPDGSPFYSVNDVGEGAVSGYVYDAYVDVHRVDVLSRLRIGRQTIWDTPELAFLDGVSAETEEFGAMEAQFGAYAGISTHLYESSHSGDWMLGAYAQGRPWAGGRLRLDWMHLEDETLVSEHQDDLYAARYWQKVARKVDLEAGYSRIESRDRDVRGRVAFNEPAADLMVQATYYQLLRTQKDLVIELDPYYETLREYYPFWQVGGMVAKGLGEHLDLQVGVDVRRVRDESDIGTNNRDYERYYGTGTLQDIGTEGLYLSVTADYWQSEDEDIETLSGDLGYRLDAKWDASVGTYYSLYKYDLFTADERDHVRTYFAKVRHKASADLTLDLWYELEDDDFDTYHTLRLGGTWRF